MATTKRMFSNDIVGSDAFYEMPSTSQNLYFHLGMRCDDDGFVNPNVTMRMIGANKNDLDVLVTKKFLIPFKNGVVVIKHHRINNKWDSRDSRRTLYTEELKQLFIKENNAYTVDENKGIPVVEAYPKLLQRLPDGNPTGTRRQNRIEENRINIVLQAKPSKEEAQELRYEPDSEKETRQPSEKHPETARVVAYFVGKVKNELGQVVKDSIAGRTIVKRALTRISEKDCNEKIDEWFTRSLKDQSLMSITHCFSDNEVNGFLTGYAK